MDIKLVSIPRNWIINTRWNNGMDIEPSSSIGLCRNRSCIGFKSKIGKSTGLPVFKHKSPVFNRNNCCWECNLTTVFRIDAYTNNICFIVFHRQSLASKVRTVFQYQSGINFNILPGGKMSNIIAWIKTRSHFIVIDYLCGVFLISIANI